LTSHAHILGLLSLKKHQKYNEQNQLELQALIHHFVPSTFKEYERGGGNCISLGDGLRTKGYGLPEGWGSLVV